MNPTLPAEAAEFGASARKAFDTLGGVDLARRVEADPNLRQALVQPALDGLGLADVDPRADLDTAAAAGELCRAAGRVALPYPVAAALLSMEGRPFAIVAGREDVLDHGDLFPEWRVSTIDGDPAVGRPAAPRLGTKLGPFVVPMVTDPDPGNYAGADTLLHLTLTAWTILGALERAVELAVEHVSGRVQFGKPLATFQAVQFQLADAAVAVDGLRELCHFTLWRVAGSGGSPDALALRLHALDTARAVLRTTQQLFGASGVCDEYDISILVRHLQPALRIPTGAERTAAALVAAIDREGFASLFPA